MYIQILILLIVVNLIFFFFLTPEMFTFKLSCFFNYIQKNETIYMCTSAGDVVLRRTIETNSAHQPFSVRELHPAWLMFVQIPYPHGSAFPTNTKIHKLCVSVLCVHTYTTFTQKNVYDNKLAMKNSDHIYMQRFPN